MLNVDFEFIEAAKNGELGTVQKLLDKGSFGISATLNAKDNDSNTTLMNAAQRAILTL